MKLCGVASMLRVLAALQNMLRILRLAISMWLHIILAPFDSVSWHWYLI